MNNSSAQTIPNARERKLDRRIYRTRRQLQEALFSIILEKGFEAVTVEEITSRADLGRTTFYLHYRDKEDLLMASIGELVNELIDQMSNLTLADWNMESGEATTSIAPVSTLPFHHVAQNARLYKIILRGEGTYTVLRRLHEIIVNASSQLITRLAEREKLNLNPAMSMDVFMNYIAGAWMGLIGWWLENDMPYSPEEMASMFQKLTMRGASGMLKVNPRG
ncbi:MAG: TetR/AcrR family transcriptional regulator [Chloroflexi bacterium]|nr:TetR/AcrR family transcriptional regulator [Chloroflexota bacterium]